MNQVMPSSPIARRPTTAPVQHPGPRCAALARDSDALPFATAPSTRSASRDSPCNPPARLVFAANLGETRLAAVGRSFGMFRHACTIVIMAVISVILWSRLPLCMARLRLVELTIFVVMAAYIGWLQYDLFRSGLLQRS